MRFSKKRRPPKARKRMQYLTIVAVIVIAYIAFNGRNESSSEESSRKPDIGFEVVKEENLSFSNTIRYQYRIRLDENATEKDLESICGYVIYEQKKIRSYNAISLLFYTSESDIDGHYTAGSATWAPDGKWENANEVRTGDYTQHELHIDFGNALGDVIKNDATGIPEATRKKIFHDLVAEQDKGTGDEKAYEIVAEQYETDLESVREIAIEGVVKGWPFP